MAYCINSLVIMNHLNDKVGDIIELEDNHRNRLNAIFTYLDLICALSRNSWNKCCDIYQCSNTIFQYYSRLWFYIIEINVLFLHFFFCLIFKVFLLAWIFVLSFSHLKIKKFYQFSIGTYCRIFDHDLLFKNKLHNCICSVISIIRSHNLASTYFVDCWWFIMDCSIS